MSATPPFRKPCAGTSSGSSKRYRCCDDSSSSSLVDKYTNTTIVENWDPTDTDHPTIPPYERWTPDLSGGDSCEVHHCVVDGAPCDAWPKPYTANTFSHTDGDQVNFAVSKKSGFKNVQGKRNWHGTFGWTAPESGCPTNFCDDGPGWQAYQSNASQTKYLTITVDASFEMSWDDEDGTTIFNVSSAASGARTVDANSGEITSTISTSEDDSHEPDPAGGSGGEIQTLHVENGAGWRLEDSGVVDFASGLSSNMDGISATDAHCDHVAMPGNDFFGGGSELQTLIADWNGEHPDFPFDAITDPNNYDSTVNFTGAGAPPATYRISWARSGTVYSWDVEYTASVTDELGRTFTSSVSFTGSLTLSNPNPADTVLSDIETNLLSLWPLNDDELYPWRTDLKVSLAPLVSRSETGPQSPLGFNTYTVDDLTSPIDDADGNAPFSGGWSPTYDQRAWFDPVVYLYTYAAGTDGSDAAATDLVKQFDGSILGAPKPAGYQNFFDFGYQDWTGCCFMPEDDPGSQTWSWYQVGWGMAVGTFNSNSGCQLPLNATQWNNYFQAVNKPPGAWIIYADKGDYFGSGCVSSSGHSGSSDAGSIMACKWAEILETWDSQNFARPAGADKFLVDENHVYCATNASGSGAGSTWNLIDPISGLAPEDGTTFSGYWGGPVVDGFYTVTSYSAGVLTLGTKIYDVPSDWASMSNSDEASCFGNLRFPTASAILGRTAITTDLTGTTFTFTEAQTNFGMTTATHQEAVDLFDSSMTAVATNVTATRVDDTHFTIASGQPTAVFAMIHGAAKWYMNDTDPKGDYVELEWTSDFRTPGELARLTGILDCDGVQVALPTENAGGGDPSLPFTSFDQTAGCLPNAPCAPRVVCISPNGEDFPNGETYDFPDTFTVDEQYGSKWWGYVQSTMTDLFWQQPHRPCNIKICAKWQMDGPLCSDDVPWDGDAVACPGDDGYGDGESVPPIYYYRFTPLVEARLTVPANYGAAQDESAPALPSGVVIGWLSPVTHASTDGNVAFPPLPPGPQGSAGGVPGGFNTPQYIHGLLCTYGPGCRFDYTTPDC